MLFLHGQFNLRVIPPSTHDLIFFQGNYFLYWPPFPAIVLMPLVAVFGVNFSDILFNILVAGLNTYLVAVVLRRAGELEIVNLSFRPACVPHGIFCNWHRPYNTGAFRESLVDRSVARISISCFGSLKFAYSDRTKSIRLDRTCLGRHDSHTHAHDICWVVASRVPH